MFNILDYINPLSFFIAFLKARAVANSLAVISFSSFLTCKYLLSSVIFSISGVVIPKVIIL